MSKINITGKAFIPFITAGDPDMQSTAKFIKALSDGGASVIELGIPFSDPVADGEVIQKADIRALDAGASVEATFKMLATLRGIKSSIVILTYFNPVNHYGIDKFFQMCAKTNVAGVIVPDCPLEELSDIAPSAEKYGVDIIQIVAPTSNDRLEKLVAISQGFIYLVSSMGVTGKRQSISDLADVYKRIKAISPLPVCVGFGVSSPEQASEYAKVVDGVIVGSAIVEIIEKFGTSASKELEAAARAFTSAVNN